MFAWPDAHGFEYDHWGEWVPLTVQDPTKCPMYFPADHRKSVNSGQHRDGWRRDVTVLRTR